jgi:fatty aldehyde decarbonylase
LRSWEAAGTRADRVLRNAGTVSASSGQWARHARRRLRPEHPKFRDVYGAILSHIVTGEIVGMEHYARMIPLSNDPRERLEILGDAWHEGRHLSSVLEVAKHVGVEVTWAVDDAYWGGVRVFFEERAAVGDLTGCLVIQDLVLESFAVALYGAVLPGLEPEVAECVAAILTDEKEHLAHGAAALRRLVEEDPSSTAARVEPPNESVARLLASWLRPQDCAPACGVCVALQRTCLKPDLELIGVDLVEARAGFLSTYGHALRQAGFSPARVTRWLARLPA